MKKLVVLSGAGISAESGIKTFRDENGLWEGHDVMKVASPQGWEDDASLVLDFYNQRRAQLNEVQPNLGHELIAEFENKFNVVVITQNVDDLHERAGSNHVLHLHGELRKARSIVNPNLVEDCFGDIHLGDKASDGFQLRPHIVWFGESVPMMEVAITQISDADIVIVVGTSLQVYPAAGLLGFAPHDAITFYVDPKPNISFEVAQREGIKIISKIGSVGLQMVKEILIK